MYYWIFQNQIAGISDRWIEASEWPFEFQLIEGPSASTEAVYFDAEAEEIKFRPARPNDAAYWNVLTNQWVDPLQLSE